MTEYEKLAYVKAKLEDIVRNSRIIGARSTEQMAQEALDVIKKERPKVPVPQFATYFPAGM